MKSKTSHWLPITWVILFLGAILCGFVFSKALVFAIGILYLAYLNPIESSCFFAFIFSAIYMVKAMMTAQLVDSKTQI